MYSTFFLFGILINYFWAFFSTLACVEFILLSKDAFLMLSRVLLTAILFQGDSR